jgi:hypothetical protein
MFTGMVAAKTGVGRSLASVHPICAINPNWCSQSTLCAADKVATLPMETHIKNEGHISCVHVSALPTGNKKQCERERKRALRLHADIWFGIPFTQQINRNQHKYSASVPQKFSLSHSISTNAGRKCAPRREKRNIERESESKTKIFCDRCWSAAFLFADERVFVCKFGVECQPGAVCASKRTFLTAVPASQMSQQPSLYSHDTYFFLALVSE